MYLQGNPIRRRQGRYLPLNYDTTKLNEFLACARRDRPVEVYYDEFIKLSRHAPHVTVEQTLSRFIQGLEGILAEEVKALRPVSLAEALIRAKSKLKSIEKRNFSGNKRKEPPLSETQPFRNQRSPHPQAANFVGPTYPRNMTYIASSVAAMQEPLGPQCFKCGKRGHLQRECNEPRNKKPPPNRPLRSARPPLSPQEQVFLAHRNSQRGGRGGRNRRCGNGNPKNQRRQYQVQGVANQVTLNDKFEEEAEIQAALDPNGRNQHIKMPPLCPRCYAWRCDQANYAAK